MAEWIWELLAGPDTITEGPAWDGHVLLYTSIAHNEIRRYNPATDAITVVYRDTDASNGLFLADDGTLYACEGASGAVVRYDTAGRKTILVSQFEGKRLNSPNDLVRDRQGRIWFTDPRYGSQDGRELDHDSVYRLTPTAGGSTPWPIERLTFDTTRPNGLLLSPDERTLYIAQSDYSGDRQLRAYPVGANGSLGQFRVLHDFGDARGIDGMCLDTEANIIATCGWEKSGPGPRIAIFAPDGTLLDEHDLPGGNPTNCVFGGPDLAHLYVTTLDGRLYRVRNPGRRGRGSRDVGRGQREQGLGNKGVVSSHVPGNSQRPTSRIPRPTSHVPRPTSHVPRPTSHVPHPTSHVPRPSTRLRHPSPRHITI